MHADFLHSKLASILQQNTTSVHEAVVRRLGKLRPSSDSAFVLFGCGELGRAVLRLLRGAGKHVLAFCDSNPARQGSQVDGVPVLSPTEGMAICGGKNLLVMTVYTNAPLRKKLDSMGVNALSFAELAWCYPSDFLPYQCLELPDKIVKNATKVVKGLEIWADNTSRLEYVGQISWRMSLNPAFLSPHCSAQETYFPPDVFQLKSDEVFVDCGAFDGDSIRGFLDRTKGRFKQIIALEPDAANFARLQNSLRNLMENDVRLIQKAVGERSEEVRFNAMGTVASVIGQGSFEVDCVTLDELLSGPPPTFIKMDIEGGEPAALRGGAGVITKHAPVLAICLYHAQEHLWEIPLYLNKLMPDYQLFLRRYADECWELVCYAVPLERCRRL
jgi:FkbM family methyltransferase